MVDPASPRNHVEVLKNRTNSIKVLGAVTSSRTIAVLTVFIGCGALLVLWFKERKAAEWKHAEAASASRTRAEQGDVKAQFDLGFRYYQGNGVPKDYAEAVRDRQFDSWSALCAT